MKFVRDLAINQRIKAVKYGKQLEGVITKKLPGAVLIRLDNGKEEVVDIDRVKQTIDKKDEQKSKRKRKVSK